MELSEAVATRISHDLAGLAGALSQTASLMRDQPDFVAEALPLLQETSQTLCARLQFLRLVFGAAGAPPDKEVIQRWLAAHAPHLQLLGEPRHRLHASLIALAAELLPQGGTVHLFGDGAVLTAPQAIALSDSLHAILTRGQPAVTPQTALAHWIYAQACALDRPPRCELAQTPPLLHIKI